MDALTLKLYRKFRAPKLIESYPGKLYQTCARIALHLVRYEIEAARIKEQFEHEGGEYWSTDDPEYHKEASRGDMRIVCSPEMCIDIEDMEGDMFNPDANPDIHPRILAKQREEWIDMLERDGVWNYSGEVFDGEDWQHIDGIGWIEGDSFESSGYAHDIRLACLGAREGMLEEDAHAIEASRPDMYAS